MSVNLNSGNNVGVDRGTTRENVEFQAIILATAVGNSLFPLTGVLPASANNDSAENATTSSTPSSSPSAATPNNNASSASTSNPTTGAGADDDLDGPAGETFGRSQLPLANRPLLWFQLDMLHKAGFPRCIVVSRENMRKGVQRVVDEWIVARGGVVNSSNNAADSNNNNNNGLLQVDLVFLDKYLGSADALRRIAPKIHTDFFVLGGDLVTNVPFQNLADLARAQDAGLVMATQDEAALDANNANAAAADSKERKKAEAEAAAAGVDAQYFGIDASTNRLLLFKSAADIEEQLEISKKLLTAHPRFTLHTKIKDAHLYLFSQWVLYFLQSKPSIVSIQSELIPCLVAGQYKKSYAEWKMYGKNSTQNLALRMSHADRKENESVLLLLGGGASNANQNASAADLGLGQPSMLRGVTADVGVASSNNSLRASTSMTDMKAEEGTSTGGFGESFRLFIYPISSGNFCMRASTLSAYKTLNHELCSDREYAYMPWPTISTDNCAEKASRLYAANTNIGPGTVIGADTKFEGEGGLVKKSCIGRHCTIGARVKINGCILMDGVVVEEGCTLQDCIISAGVTIGANSTLKDCKIGPSYKVAPGTDGKNEILCEDDE